VDENGKAHKPFLLPQKNPQKYYADLMLCYNIPELAKTPVELDQRSLGDKLMTDPGINVKYRKE
ncbi:MAG: hypothetical protein HUJ99_02595, partial [Bacteroidaceae bacterium]|nr:hypothetical protein [Bacteroidaceae bacterium]